MQELIKIECDVSKDPRIMENAERLRERVMALDKKMRETVEAVVPTMSFEMVGDKDILVDRAKAIMGVDFTEELLAEQKALDAEFREIANDVARRLMVPVQHEQFKGFAVKELSFEDMGRILDDMSVLTFLTINAKRITEDKTPVRTFSILLMAKDELQPHGPNCACANVEGVATYMQEEAHFMYKQKGENKRWEVKNCQHPVEGMRDVLEGKGELESHKVRGEGNSRTRLRKVLNDIDGILADLDDLEDRDMGDETPPL